MEVKRVQALAALCSLQYKKKLSVEKTLETDFSSNEETEKYIENYVQRENAVTRKRVQNKETAIIEKLNDMTTAEMVRGTTRKPKTTVKEIMNDIGDSLSNLASSYDEQDSEDDDDDETDTELCKRNDDDEPGWVMGTMCRTVQYSMERFCQKQMRLDELTQPGWGDAANYFHEIIMKYGSAELKVPAVVKPQIHTTSATPSPTTFGKRMQTLDIVHEQSQMPAVTSQPGSTQFRLDSE